MSDKHKFEDVFMKFCRYNLQEAHSDIKGFEELEDGSKLCLIAKTICNEKEIKFHDSPVKKKFFINIEHK